ncbi:MFS transporter [Streptomyces sp. TRM68367]|uniref:MFS transporter n=1 Tax=Streptomyces sp. TRM68367 TaxID=2758415 RepID=UPI002934346E|nr:MFS transporter [Streptomyces sp. TRM68367]
MGRQDDGTALEHVPAGAGGGRRRAGWVLAVASAAQFLVVLDVSVVNVALPSIRSALGFAPADLSWVVNAYGLAFAGLLPLGGRLADVLGHARAFVLGLALFAAASLAGGLAGAPGPLVAARAVQGAGAALLAPATLTVLTGTFPEGPARTRALAVWTAVGVAGGAAGNLVGGTLTEYLSWRSTLLANVPVGAAGALLALRVLPGRRPGRGGRPGLDVPGAVLATAGLAALSYGLTRTESHGWHDPVTPGAMAAGALTLAAFAWFEARLARSPLVPLRLLRLRSVAVGNVILLLTGGCLIPMWYFLSLYMQQVLHYGPLRTAVGFLPHTLLTMAVAARLAPRLLTYAAPRTLIAGAAVLCAAGFWWQSRIGPDSGYADGVLGPALLVSAGSGLLLTPVTSAVTSGVDPADAGAASGLMNTAKQVGGALGLAALSALAAADAPGVRALTAGYARAFLAIAVVLAAVAAVSLALPRQNDPSH